MRLVRLCCSELSCTPERPNWISANFISSAPRELWPCSPPGPSLRNQALNPDGRTRLAYLNVQPSFCVFTCFKLIIETFGGVQGQPASVFVLFSFLCHFRPSLGRLPTSTQTQIIALVRDGHVKHSSSGIELPTGIPLGCSHQQRDGFGISALDCDFKHGGT